MTTEILRRGDNLNPAVSQSQADGAGVDVVCVNGCGVPMQPVDRDGFAFRCSACDEITVDRRKIDLIEHEATTLLDQALFDLVGLQQTLKLSSVSTFVVTTSEAPRDRCLKMVPASTAFTPCVLWAGHEGDCVSLLLAGDPRAVTIIPFAPDPSLAIVERIIGLLTSSPVEAFANAIHTAAIGNAMRICVRRSDSLITDSGNPFAANEAAKCALAIARIRERVSLNAAAEPSIEFPEAAHA